MAQSGAATYRRVGGERDERPHRRICHPERLSRREDLLAASGQFLLATDRRQQLQLAGIDSSIEKAACGSVNPLGLEPSPIERDWIDRNRALVDAAEADLKRLPVIAATPATAVAEVVNRYGGATGPTARRYLDMIETWGYRPTEAEQALRLAAANHQPAA